MPTHDERRVVAQRMRECADDGSLFYIPVLSECMGLKRMNYPDDQSFQIACWDRLADLVDPADNGLVAEDNLKLIDRCRDLECELARLKANS